MLHKVANLKNNWQFWERANDAISIAIIHVWPSHMQIKNLQPQTCRLDTLIHRNQFSLKFGKVAII
jgi:hypothetical protein